MASPSQQFLCYTTTTYPKQIFVSSDNSFLVAALTETHENYGSSCYMPLGQHKLSGEQVQAMTNAELKALQPVQEAFAAAHKSQTGRRSLFAGEAAFCCW
jgi:hypothetical protein